jgi:putative transposase
VRGWSDALIVVKPNTLKKWHREEFRIYWRHKSKGIPHQPRISPEAIALIKQMALENRTWGAKRIRDELRKLGHRISKRIVRQYMKQTRRDWPPRQSGQTWAAVSIGYLIRRWLVAAMRYRAINSSLLFQFSAVSIMTTAGLLEGKNTPDTLSNHHTWDRSLALA